MRIDIHGSTPAPAMGQPDPLCGRPTSGQAAPYAIPDGQPGASGAIAAACDEVWSYGWRNPWRYSFDRLTGDLCVADVGQGTYEEINRIAAEQKGYPSGGLNFGWPIMEGTHCFPESAACDRTGLVIPIAEYTHAEGGCSVTGGYVYRGTAFPILDGVYFYGDYCSGFVWALHPTANGTWQADRILETGLSISSFGEDETGELYLPPSVTA